MGFFMRKIQMLLSLFISQPTVFAGGCICRREEVTAKPDRIVVITQNLPASNSTFTDSPFYHPSNIPLCAALLLSNPHNRSFRAAPRFSPTRFIPRCACQNILELDCLQALGINRYTLGRSQTPSKTYSSLSTQ